jgi:hypothetical protein
MRATAVIAANMVTVDERTTTLQISKVAMVAPVARHNIFFAMGLIFGQRGNLFPSKRKYLKKFSECIKLKESAFIIKKSIIIV